MVPKMSTEIIVLATNPLSIEREKKRGYIANSNLLRYSGMDRILFVLYNIKYTSLSCPLRQVIVLNSAHYYITLCIALTK